MIDTAYLDKLHRSATHPSIPKDEQARAKRRFLEAVRLSREDETFAAWPTLAEPEYG